MKKFFTLAMVVGLAFGSQVGIACGQATSPKAHDPADLANGELAPEIEGKDINGEPLKLSDFRGKVVVLDFWGDW